MSQLQMFSFRLPEEAISEMEEIADHLYIPVRTMARQWIMQRLDAISIEKENETAAGSVPARSMPARGEQPTHEGVIANDNID